MMIKKLLRPFINKNGTTESSERNSNNKSSKESDDLVDNYSEHNQCFINDELNSSTCTNESNYNWCMMAHEINNDLNNKLNNKSINRNTSKSNRNQLTKNCLMECFMDGMNVSGISRRRILANIDYDVDGQFMCSTLIKDAKENEDDLKAKFHHQKSVDQLNAVNSTSAHLIGNDQTNKLSNYRLAIISKHMQEAETVKHMNKLNKNSLIRQNPVRKTSTLNSNSSNNNRNNHICYDKLDEELIYDSGKPFSDLSSIEEARLDNLRNRLKDMQMNSIDKRRILSNYLNGDCRKFNRNSLIEHENLLSEMYNSENSSFINQIKQIQNHHNNQVIHDINDEDTWFCKTKLYDDTLDQIVRKWDSLDSEIWCKIICCERNRVVAKAYIRLPYFIVNGNNVLFDGYTVGLNGSENMYRDQETDFIVKSMDRGVRIKIDEEGNLILRKMTHLSVQVKDWLQQLTEGQGSLSDDVIALHGKIPFNQPVKVFDIDRFANNLRQELEQKIPNRRRLAKQCIIGISFGKQTYNVLNSPSWLLVVNLHALRMIEKTQRIPKPDYGLSDNLEKVCPKEDGANSCSSSSSDGLDSMNSSDDPYGYASGFTKFLS